MLIKLIKKVIPASAAGSGKKLLKRALAGVLSAVMCVSVFGVLPVSAAEPETATIQNDYIKVVVSSENGGYTITTTDGDILKTTDSNKKLLRGLSLHDSSFTSFRVGEKDYVFGSDYTAGDIFDFGNVTTVRVSDTLITSTWTVPGIITAVQEIELVEASSSEQLGTARISYTVTNLGASADIKSRLLMDTQIGDRDFGYYEAGTTVMGQESVIYETETELSGMDVPAAYFAKDAPQNANIAAYGVTSTQISEKPYKMIFAHWANLAASKFDYTPDPSMKFTTSINNMLTSDSAAALYYDLGTVGSEPVSFTTYYGVTANVKNKDNRVILNTSAPSRLTLNAERNAYIGSTGAADGRVKVTSIVSNPLDLDKKHDRIAVVAYTYGFEAERMTDAGEWTVYSNADPLRTVIEGFDPGESITAQFDFRFTPKDNTQIGSFTLRVFDISENENYSDQNLLGETVNYIYIEGKDNTAPPITLGTVSPENVFNEDDRLINITGRGLDLLGGNMINSITLKGEKQTYTIPAEAFTPADSTTEATILLTDYMVPGRYSIHFNLYEESVFDKELMPLDFTSPSMSINISDDEQYRNDTYGILTVEQTNTNNYIINTYKNEKDLETAKKTGLNEIMFTIRGKLVQDKINKDLYRAVSTENVTINGILSFYGDDFSVTNDNESVRVKMDGKLTTVGSNTTVRNGSALFELKHGTEYIFPIYNSRGEIAANGIEQGGQSYIELKWDSGMDVMQTIGGFLIDLRYGLLGKMQGEGSDSSTLYDIISFGGALDLSFMTIGGAKTAREEKRAQEHNNNYAVTPYQSNYNPSAKGGQIEAGAQITDVIYGQSSDKVGYQGINMNANITMPQIVAFLPAKMQGSLAVNTIGGYEVGIDGSADLASFSLDFSFVIKSAPNGAPIPDKLYFAMGGFEPGINIDSAGVVWITGAGGGFDNLYDTIYGTGVPPLTLLLHAEFDIVKILSGTADLELSLRYVKLSLGQVNLKAMDGVKFLDGGHVYFRWLPNFEFSAGAKVNFLSLFKGEFSITANEKMFEFFMRVALSLPGEWPIIGGMEIASAELGGGTEKMWGGIKVLGIGVGFTYWWDSGDFQFRNDGPQESNSRRVLAAIQTPRVAQTDPETGDVMYMSLGTNLRAARTSQMVNDTHLITFDTDNDYILAVRRKDGDIDTDDFKDNAKAYINGVEYTLNIYESANVISDNTTELDDDDRAEMEAALANANVNIVGDTAYIAVPYSARTGFDSIYLDLGTAAYEVTSMEVAPIPELFAYIAPLNGNQIDFAWEGTALDDDTTVSLSIYTDSNYENGILLESDITAADCVFSAELPATLPSGTYYAGITLSKEGVINKLYKIAAPINYSNPNAPLMPADAALTQAGNNLLKVNILGNGSNDGYSIDVYEDGVIKQAGLYAAAEYIDNIYIGGTYNIPILDENNEPVLDVNDIPAYTVFEYNNTSDYTVIVRAIKEGADGSQYMSAGRQSQSVKIRAAQKPDVTLTVADSTPSTIAQDTVYTLTNDNTVNIACSQAITGTLSVDGGAGGVVDVTETGEIAITLEDGTHTLEFAAENTNGDTSVTTLFVIADTTAPVLMIESPVNGDLYDTNTVTVSGAADPADIYNYYVDNSLIAGGKTYTDGILSESITLSTESTSQTLVISATDAAGNISEQSMTLYNGNTAEIESVRLYMNGSPVDPSGLTFGRTEIRSLQLFGRTNGGDNIDITDDMNTTFYTMSGNNLDITGNTATAGDSDGAGIIAANYSLGGNAVLTDAVGYQVSGLNLSELRVLLTQYSDLDRSGYSKVSLARLDNAVSAANLILSVSATDQAAIDLAVSAISNAFHTLAPATPAPAKPVLTEISYSGFTVSNNYETTVYGDIEYAIKPEDAEEFNDWTALSGEITGLTPLETYVVVTRHKGNENFDPSLASEETVVDIPNDNLPTVGGGYAPVMDDTDPENVFITSYTYIITPLTGAEYKMDDGEWQEDNIFTGIVPDSEHTFSVRIKATATHKAGQTGSTTVTFTELEEYPPVPDTALNPAVIDPNGGAFTDPQPVLLTSAQGAAVYYTTDGSAPNIHSKPAPLDGIITVKRTGTIKALAVKSGFLDSPIAEADFIINAEAVLPPVISPANSTFRDHITVTMTSETPGAEIYYTTDGTDPSYTSNRYGTPFTLTSSTTIKAIAVKTGMADSAVVTASYTYTPSGNDNNDNNDDNDNNQNNTPSAPPENISGYTPGAVPGTVPTDPDKKQKWIYDGMVEQAYEVYGDITIGGETVRISGDMRIALPTTEQEFPAEGSGKRGAIYVNRKRYRSDSFAALRQIAADEVRKTFISINGSDAAVTVVKNSGDIYASAGRDGKLDLLTTLEAVKFAAAIFGKDGPIHIYTANDTKMVTAETLNELAKLAKKLGIMLKLTMAEYDKDGVLSTLSVTVEGEFTRDLIAGFDFGNETDNNTDIPADKSLPESISFKTKEKSSYGRRVRLSVRMSKLGLSKSGTPLAPGSVVTLRITDPTTGKQTIYRGLVYENGQIYFRTDGGGQAGTITIDG
jgi:hypothetical protein